MTDIDLEAIKAERARLEAAYITPDRPATSARGIHHAALICSNVEQTIKFYQGILEFPLTELFGNRDYKGSTHFFFDVGNGNLLAFFDFPGLDLEPYKETLGNINHIAISVTKEKWDHLRGKLDAAGVEYQVASGTSIYFKDPDGVRLELLADPLGEMYGTKVLLSPGLDPPNPGIPPTRLRCDDWPTHARQHLGEDVIGRTADLSAVPFLATALRVRLITRHPRIPRRPLMTKALRQSDGLDVTRPSPARIYDYMLRGRHHFEADADAAERILSVVPEIRDCAWSNRGFHQRAAAWIARQGVKQFLDIGSGLPTVGNTHEVVRKIHPDARVVYVDNDPMVELHSQGILDETGLVSVLCADLREPDTILDHPAVRELIDPAEPTGLLMTAVLMFVSDAAQPWDLVARYVHAMRSGSFLSLSHLTDDAKPPVAVDGFRRVFDRATEQMHFRSKAQIARFFDGLEIVPPYEGASSAITYSGLWGAEDVQMADSDGSRWLYCAVARIP